MQLEDMTLLAFTTCNSLRILAYLPQIIRAARDSSGCVGISYGTWALFLIANLSGAAYAIVNVADSRMAVVFSGNAIGCLIILAVVGLKRQRHARAATVLP